MRDGPSSYFEYCRSRITARWTLDLNTLILPVCVSRTLQGSHVLIVSQHVGVGERCLRRASCGGTHLPHRPRRRRFPPGRMVFSAVGRFAKLHPIKFGCVFSCAKTSFSDWLVQSQLEKRERIDWQRNGTFAAFGFFYLGGVQYFLYVPLFSRLFPSAAAYAAASVSAKLADGPGTRRMIAQVVIDQFVHHPLLYFPAFYSLKEVVKGGTVSEGLARYSNNYKEDLPALWKV
eukprot:1420504-Prymnesium_polylepis.2